jgi:hypothetical protein
MSKRATREKRDYVATLTFSGGANDEKFYEAGAVYDHKPPCKFTNAGRLLVPDEHVVACPRCGQRFAATADSTAEDCRDLHFHGDEEIPSICAKGATDAH